MIRRIKDDIWIYAQIAVGICAYIFVKAVVFKSQCPIYNTFGVPCAGCGMTRALKYLIQGDFVQSFEANPFLIPIALVLIYCFVFRYVLGKKIPYWIPMLVVLAVAMIVFNVFRIVTFFG